MNAIAHASRISHPDKLRLLEALLGLYDIRGFPRPSEEPMLIAHYGTPQPKQRHRTGGGRTFTPTATAHRAEELRRAFALAFRGRKAYPGAVAIVGYFFEPDLRHVDGDNLMKLAKDAANPRPLPPAQRKALERAGRKPPAPIVWKDDSQVLAELPFVELDREQPRTLLALAPWRSSMPRYPEEIDGLEACRFCGCTELRACLGGCAWVADNLCSACDALGFGP